MKKKTSWLGFLAPYLLVGAIIFTILMMFGGNGNASSVTFAVGDVITASASDDQTKEDANGKTEWELNAEKSILYTEDVKNLSYSMKTTTTYISGRINLPADTKLGYRTYSFSLRLDASENTLNVLNYIVETRISTEDANVKYYTSKNFSYSDPYESNVFMDYLPTILIIGAGILLTIFMFSRLGNSINKSNNSAMEFNRSRARREDASTVRFDDVAGCDEEKAEMVEIVDYLRRPERYSKYGAKLPKGVLLIGPPGTGKTLLAKAVAGEAKVPFYSISGSDFVEMFVGVGAGRVRDMFKKAKATAPCLIFIDEIDAVGRQRGAGLGGGNDEREQTLNQLLVEMDGFSDNAGIIVIAATNREDVLDPALLRAGRFDRQITVDLPDRKGREAILKVHARNKVIDETIDFSNIAKRTVGFSGADLANVLNEAAILAVRDNKSRVSVKEVDEAIDRRIAGPAKTSRSLTEKEKRSVAFHEAGHAIIGLKLPHSNKVQKVTIVPRGRTGGHVLMTPEEDRFLLTKDELFAEIVGYLGGRSSEEVFFEDVSTGASQDISVATRIARAMVTQYGMSALGPIQYESNSDSVFLGRDYTSNQKNFSSQIAFEIDKEIRALIEKAHERAVALIKEYVEDVTLIANALMERETLNAEQIDYLLIHREMPIEVVEPVKEETTDMEESTLGKVEEKKED